MHFKQEDFINGQKLRKLIRGCVPSQFPSYPSYRTNQTVSTRQPPTLRTLNTAVKRKIDKSTENLPIAHQYKSVAVQVQSRPSYHDLEETIIQLKKEITVMRMLNRRKDKIISNLRKQNRLISIPKEDKSTPVLNKIESDAKYGEVKALILLEQIKGYGQSHYQWSEVCLRACILWRDKAPKSYNFVRKYIANFPCKTTLQKYIGPSSLQTGFTPLVKLRLQDEVGKLSDVEKFSSLIFDEMAICPKLSYHRQSDKVIGTAQFGKDTKENSQILANRLLCFVLKGLNTNFSIPVAYYFVRQLQGIELSKIILTVIKDCEQIGFKICRIVSDDAKINVKALEDLNGGKLSHEINHPIRSGHPLFISFDPCHIVKNIRNQLFDDKREMKMDGMPISGNAIKKLYELQKNVPIKLVRFLNRKTVYPTNFEKMNVKRAISIFSSEVIAALEFCSQRNMPGFRNLTKTIEFLQMIKKWFTVNRFLYL